MFIMTAFGYDAVLVIYGIGVGGGCVSTGMILRLLFEDWRARRSPRRQKEMEFLKEVRLIAESGAIPGWALSAASPFHCNIVGRVLRDFCAAAVKKMEGSK